MNGEEILRELAGTPDPEIHETHGSWVVLTEDHALKIKKPVKWSFLDYTTLDRRRVACEQEVDVNRELAPGIYLGTRPVVLERDGTVRLGQSEDASRAVEFVVEMLRFDDRLTMDALLRAGTLTEADIDNAADRIARFHAGAAVQTTDDAVTGFASRYAADLDDVEQLGTDVEDLRRFATAFTERHKGVIARRADEGLIRDGHGDLRAEHIVLSEPLAIVDRLEFDASMRAADVADDLSFLAMDLESRGGRWASDRLLTAYAAAGGHAAPPTLAAGFAWRRAIVRAKVDLLREREERAGVLLRLADRLAWRARADTVIVVCGPPASGKSTVAQRLAELMELQVISSDRVRKEMLGLAPTDRAAPSAYTAQITHQVYAQISARAKAQPVGAIVDATFGRRADRERLLKALAATVHWVWCDPAHDVRESRARAREDDPQRESDAGAAIAIELARRFEPLDELPATTVLRLADQSSRTVEREVARLLDRSVQTT